jgi:hypothetical protein
VASEVGLMPTVDPFPSFDGYGDREPLTPH